MTKKEKAIIGSVGVGLAYLIFVRKANASTNPHPQGEVSLDDIFYVNGVAYYTDGSGQVPQSKLPK